MLSFKITVLNFSVTDKSKGVDSVSPTDRPYLLLRVKNMSVFNIGLLSIEGIRFSCSQFLLLLDLYTQCWWGQ